LEIKVLNADGCWLAHSQIKLGHFLLANVLTVVCITKNTMYYIFLILNIVGFRCERRKLLL